MSNSSSENQHPKTAEARTTRSLAQPTPLCLVDEKERRELIEAAMNGPCRCDGSGYFRVPDLVPATMVECSCAAQRNRARRIQRLFADAGVPEKFINLTFEDFEALPPAWREGKEHAASAARWFANVANYDRSGGVRMAYRRDDGKMVVNVRPGLLLFGPVGTCKTGLASIVARAWLDAGRSVAWVTYVHLIKAVQSGYGNGYGNGDISEQRVVAVQNADLLVLDDLGSRRVDRQESYDRNEILYRILERRHVERRATLITTNLMPNEIEHQFDDRIASRLFEMCHWLSTDGVDLRKAQALGGVAPEEA